MSRVMGCDAARQCGPTEKSSCDGGFGKCSFENTQQPLLLADDRLFRIQLFFQSQPGLGIGQP